MLFYICVAAAVVAFALYFKQKCSRFNKYGVKNHTFMSRLGNMGLMLTRLKHYIDIVNTCTQVIMGKDIGFYRFFGNYEFMTPAIFIRDLDLIKKVTVKDFEHFLDHRTFVSEELDPFFGRNLFSLKGQEWKDMRSTLSPAFTSSKMKHMLPFIVEVGNQMVRSLKIKIEESGTKSIEIDVKDLSTRYANDVIASCTFGLRVDSQSEPDNEFYQMGHSASNFGFWQLLKFFAYTSMPLIMKKYKFALFSEEVRVFFEHLVLSTMRNREAHSIIRPDMIHLLMEAKKGRLTHDKNSGKDADAGFATVEESNIGKKTINRAWSDVDLIAQAVLFFIAGFETVSTTMTFLIYELAVNPEVQDKLVDEIREHDRNNDGKFDYNSIQTMTYMDMVISELLRLWPPAVTTDRLCVKEYNLGRPNENATADYVIKAGEGLHIPIMAIQHDPQYFPDPMKFDPERFSDENKHKIQPFTYLPFGVGPRNCIGSRFALCEVKVMVYMLLQHFEVIPSERTRIPIQLSTESFNLRMKGGHWLRLKTRT